MKQQLSIQHKSSFTMDNDQESSKQVPQTPLDAEKFSVDTKERVEQPQFRTYRIRFYGLLLIGLLNIVSSLNWLAVAPVPDYASEFFGDIGLTLVNWFSNVFLLTYIIAGPISSYVFDHYSIKTGILLGASLQTLGSWLRFFSSYVKNDSGRFGLAMVGQVICAFGQPFILNSSTPYASLWFSSNGRSSASMVSGLANAVGMAVADLILPAIVLDSSDMWMGFLIIACATTAILVPTIFIPVKPKTPPSYSALTKMDHAIPFRTAVIQLLKNRDFVIIFITFGIACGLFSTVTSLMTQIVSPYGVSVDDAGFLGAAFIIAGIVGAVLVGLFVDRTMKHKLVLKAFVPMVGFMYLALLFVVKENNFGAIMAISALLGFFTFSLLPVALELSVECSYPVSEAVSSSMLWICSQVFGLIFLVAMDALREDHGVPEKNMRRGLIMATGLAMPMMAFVSFYTSPNKRMEIEKRNRVEDQNESRMV
ncbi:major facilitator superfamily domain-containing protein [Phycomyces nitens]|nr:major facilitator superfamily domain-containing protein [Phycomyces nitens]